MRMPDKEPPAPMSENDKRLFLEQYQKLNRQIDWNLERLAEYRSFSERVTAGYSATAGSSSEILDRIQLSYDKIDALTRQINADIDRFVDLRIQIENILTRLPDPTYRSLLWKRYIVGETWEKIADDLCYCSKQVMRLHLKALQMLEIPDDLS